MEIEGNKVVVLRPRPFVCAMRQLIRAEAARQGIHQADVHITTNIDRSDGGIDGRIEAMGSLKEGRLPPGRSVWQFKSGRSAQDVTPKALRTILTKDGVATVLKLGGHFTLALAAQLGDRRRQEARDTLQALATALGHDPHAVNLLDADDLGPWATEHPAVWHHFGVKLGGVEAFTEWSASTRDFERPCISDNHRDALGLELRRGLRRRGGPWVFCVTGMSGVGKTRFVYEVLKRRRLRSRSLYAPSPEHVRPLLAVIQRDKMLSAILVVDECDAAQVKLLVHVAQSCNGRLRVVAILGPLPRQQESLTAPAEIGTLSIGSFSSAKIEELLTKVAPTASAEQRRYVAAIADGIPRIAVLFSLALARDPRLRVTELTLESAFSEWTTRLVEDPLAREVLQAIALTTRLGWDGPGEADGRLWLEALDVGPWKKVREIAQKLLEVGLIRPQGPFRYVWPHPLAVVLASRAWKDQGVGLLDRAHAVRSKEFFLRFTERLKDVSDSPEVRAVVERLLMTMSEFASFDALDDVDRAQVFAILAESHPEAGLAVLNRLMNEQSTEAFRRFSHSQPEIVDLLRRMAWRSDYFFPASHLLLRLGEADGADWADRTKTVRMFFQVEGSAQGVHLRRRYSSFAASSTWTGLFAIHWAQTSVPALERFAILRNILGGDSPGRRYLAVLALEEALHAGAIVGGRDTLGALPPEPEWKPSESEAREAAAEAFRMLAAATADPDPKVRTKAADTLLKVSGHQCFSGRTQAFLSVLDERVIGALGRAAVVICLRRLIAIDNGRLPPPDRAGLDALFARLTQVGSVSP